MGLSILSDEDMRGRLRRRRGKNLFLLFALIGVAILFYAVTILRFSGVSGAG